MKKILSNCPVSCFADEISVSLDRQIQVLNELGIKFVEFRSADGTGVADFTDEQAKEAKKRLDAAGIRVSAVGSPIGKIGIDDDFEAHMKKLQRIERIAEHAALRAGHQQRHKAVIRLDEPAQRIACRQCRAIADEHQHEHQQHPLAVIRREKRLKQHDRKQDIADNRL